MSEKHLTTGSVEPPRVDGLLRLYSMIFCPYAQRPRLVLKAKGIPHDIVNINLINKPEWYFKIHPEGKVPTLLDGDKFIIESIDISDYLDEKYPNNPLYPAEPAAKAKDKELIKSIGPITTIFAGGLFTDEKDLDQWTKQLVAALQPLEDELVARGTTFFGGDKPKMVDYMLWPWAERAPCVAIKFGQKPPIGDDQITHLRKWRKAMRKDPVCSELYIPPEKFWKLVQCRMNKENPDYDAILNSKI